MNLVLRLPISDLSCLFPSNIQHLSYESHDDCLENKREGKIISVLFCVPRLCKGIRALGPVSLGLDFVCIFVNYGHFICDRVSFLCYFLFVLCV